MSERSSATIEDYLSIIYILQRDGEPVVGARLAELLGVTPPTVTNTLKRMVRDGLLTLDDPQGPHLTDLGLEKAASVVTRHMLTEWLLVRMLKVAWSRTHSEAHSIEHSISAEIETQMRTNLDDPQLCPHGNPLPGYEYVAERWTPLTQAEKGQHVTIRRIHEMAEDNPQLMDFLENNGIVPGARAEVAEVLPFNQTITVEVGNKSVTLGFQAARFIFVEKKTIE